MKFQDNADFRSYLSTVLEKIFESGERLDNALVGALLHLILAVDKLDSDVVINTDKHSLALEISRAEVVDTQNHLVSRHGEISCVEFVRVGERRS